MSVKRVTERTISGMANRTAGPDGINPDVYRNAKSTRPGWANALIVAGVLLLGSLAMLLTMGVGVAFWLFFGGTFVTCVIAGIAALARIGNHA